MIILITLLIIIGIICLINMSNFGLGSNTSFYKTISDCPNTTWVCKKIPDAKIEVITYEDTDGYESIKSIFEIEYYGIKKNYFISDYFSKFNLFLLDDNGNQITDNENDTDGNVIRTRVKYNKNIFGKLTSFRIKVLDNDQSIAGYKTLTFHKLNMCQRMDFINCEKG